MYNDSFFSFEYLYSFCSQLKEKNIYCDYDTVFKSNYGTNNIIRNSKIHCNHYINSGEKAFKYVFSMLGWLYCSKVTHSETEEIIMIFYRDICNVQY